MAFQLDDYLKLLDQLSTRGYRLLPIEAYFDDPAGHCVYLRHDCDRMLFRSVLMAEAEQALGARATYYVRSNRLGNFPSSAITRIKEAGHCVGYHYETLTRANGNISAALERFENELTTLRQYAPIRTAAAHGSPLSRHSNRDIWKHASPCQFRLDGEAYENVDYQRVLYVTDTGGVFGSQNNLRDKVDGLNLPGLLTLQMLADKIVPEKYPQVILSTHPERWAVSAIGMVQASSLDWAKNQLKKMASVLRPAA